MMRQSSSDPLLVQAILENILTAIERIERRFNGINDPDDFMLTDEGLDRLDGIAMMLIAVGEQLKQLEQVTPLPLSTRFPDIDWKGAKGIRDVLSHHYFSLDAEIIFDVCATKIAGVRNAIKQLLDDFPSDVI